MADTLHIFAERCTHQQVVHSQCDACVRACPAGAWRMNAQGLAFDDAACDACGLCVAACPTEALSLPAPSPLVDKGRSTTLLLACERISNPPARGSGITACLHALPADGLLRWCEQHQAQRVHIACGDCAQCPRQTSDTFWRRWNAHTQPLAQCGAPLPVLERLAPAVWQRKAQALQGPDPSRRRFLGRLAHPAAAAPTEAVTSARRAIVQRLQRAAAARPGDGAQQPALQPAPLWRVHLQQRDCTLCMACTRICPQDALSLETAHAAAARSAGPGVPDAPMLSDAPDLWTWRMERCTGCGLCVDVCAPAALKPAPCSAPDHPAPAAAPEPAAYTLHTQRCSACGVAFYRFDHQVAPAHCPTCRQGRARQPGRIVQHEIPDNGRP